MNAYVIVGICIVVGAVFGYIASLWQKLHDKDNTITVLKTRDQLKEWLDEITKKDKAANEAEIDFDTLSDDFKSKHGPGDSNGSGGSGGSPGPSKL